MIIELNASLIESMAKLNSWARLSYEQRDGMDSLPRVIYAWKRAVIAAAIRAGMAKLRLIAVERPCKTCKGTGTYEWINWHDEDDRRYEDCRRCGASGKVTLRFVVSEICGQRWHTPRPKWDLGVFTVEDWETKCEREAEWEPERPGKPLEFIELVEALNAVERVLLPPLVPYEAWSRPDSRLPDYRLFLGNVWSCPFCGAEKASAAGCSTLLNSVHKPGFWWRQDSCWRDRRCHPTEAYPLQWPHDMRPPLGDRNYQDADSYHIPLPEVAYHPAVSGWLARRGIVIGSWPPDELAWHQSGVLVRVRAALPNGKLLLGLCDSQDWLGGSGFFGEGTPTFEAPPSSVRTRRRGGPWTTEPTVDYAATWVQP